MLLMQGNSICMCVLIQFHYVTSSWLNTFPLQKKEIDREVYCTSLFSIMCLVFGEIGFYKHCDASVHFSGALLSTLILQEHATNSAVVCESLMLCCKYKN